MQHIDLRIELIFKNHQYNHKNTFIYQNIQNSNLQKNHLYLAN